MVKEEASLTQFSVWVNDSTSGTDQQTRGSDEKSLSNASSKANQWTNDLDESDENYLKRQRYGASGFNLCCCCSGASAWVKGFIVAILIGGIVLGVCIPLWLRKSNNGTVKISVSSSSSTTTTDVTTSTLTTTTTTSSATTTATTTSVTTSTTTTSTITTTSVTTSTATTTTTTSVTTTSTTTSTTSSALITTSATTVSTTTTTTTTSSVSTTTTTSPISTATTATTTSSRSTTTTTTSTTSGGVGTSLTTTTTTTTTTAGLTNPSCTSTSTGAVLSFKGSPTVYTRSTYSYKATTSGLGMIEFRFFTDNSADAWMLDSVSLINLNTSGTEMLVNGNFDQGTMTGWDVLCTSNCKSASSSGQITSSGCFAGSHCYKDPCEDQFDILKQQFTKTAGHVYELSFYLKCTCDPDQEAHVKFH